ncbi:hypothetical protein [Methylomonas sp. AM2-LC]|uniref:hypothetical protein n=1 Tax=Methylomonas sp. AM2-LC TaxID=3153301 RepID=UPI0032643002
MRVPEYKRQLEVNELPAVRQTINTADYHFVGATQTALAEQAAEAGQQGVQWLAHIQAKQLQEANATRVQDAQNQTQHTINNLLYGNDGVLLKQGAEAFQPLQNNKPAASNALTALDAHITAQTANLGNDEQRQMYLHWAQAAREHVGGLLQQHEGQQLRVYQRGVAQAAIAANQQTMRLNYNDPGLLQGGVAAIQQASIKLAQLEGYPDEYGLTQALKHSAAGLSDAVQAALQHSDTDTANALLQQFGEHMDSDTLLHNTQLVTKNTDRQTAVRVAGQVMSHLAPRLQNSDALRLQNLALGAQPTATDANHFQQLLKQFKGDVTQTLAAWHAGSELTQQAMQQAGKPAGDWLAQLPANIQQSVNSQLQAFTRGGGQVNPPSQAQAQALALAQLGDTASPSLRKQVLAEVDSQFQLQSQALKQQQLQGKATALKALLDNGGRYAALPSEVLAGIAPKDVDKVLSFARGIAQGTPVATDWGLYYRLHSQPDNLKTTNLMAVRDRLNSREYQQLQTQQQRLLKGQAASNQPVQDVLNQFMREAGINPHPQPTDVQGLRTVGHINSAFLQRLTAAEQQHGKPLSFDEQQSLAAHLFTKVGVKGLLSASQDKPAVLVDSRQDKVLVPTADRQQIIQALQYLHPQAGINEDDIFYQYLQQKGLLK